MEESSEDILVQENGIYVANGSMKVKGNLEIDNQVQSNSIKVVENNNTIITSAGNAISFRKAVQFTSQVKFNNGRTIIGIEPTYNSAYVGSTTIQAGDRLIVGDSAFKITSSPKKIFADTFTMLLDVLNANTVNGKKINSTEIVVSKLDVSDKILTSNIYADVVKTNHLYIDTISCLSLNNSQTVTTKDLAVSGHATIQNDMIVYGSGSVNGAALTVDGGEIVARRGILSHTRNNKFQTLQITGSGVDNDTCFKVDPDVSSLFEGDVTIQDSNLVLDNSKLVTDNILVTKLGDVNLDEIVTGVQVTDTDNWKSYYDSMVNELPPEQSLCQVGEYDPYATMQEALQHNEENYVGVNRKVKTVLNPITYLMEKKDKNIPKQFTVNTGIYRLDTNGNAMLKSITAQNARFSQLSAYKFKVNQLHVDKLVTTSVASNVVHTDNLLKSEGIAEFDGSINSRADVFIEDGSNVSVAENASVTFQCNSSLVLKNGANLTMGANSNVKMSGDIEIDLDKLTFLDPKTGRRYKISFRDAKPFEGKGVVMDYERVEDAEPTTDEIAEETELDSRELDSKLKSLGI